MVGVFLTFGITALNQKLRGDESFFERYCVEVRSNKYGDENEAEQVKFLFLSSLE